MTLIPVNVITTQCRNGGCAVCPYTICQPRPGVLPGIKQTHQPLPPPGEDLYTTIRRCTCRCHRPTTVDNLTE